MEELLKPPPHLPLSMSRVFHVPQLADRQSLPPQLVSLAVAAAGANGRATSEAGDTASATAVAADLLARGASAQLFAFFDGPDGGGNEGVPCDLYTADPIHYAALTPLIATTRNRRFTAYPVAGLRLTAGRMIQELALRVEQAVHAHALESTAPGSPTTGSLPPWATPESYSALSQSLAVQRFFPLSTAAIKGQASDDDNKNVSTPYPRLLLYSAHDSAIMPMLLSLGLYASADETTNASDEGRVPALHWPPFGSHLAVELYATAVPKAGVAPAVPTVDAASTMAKRDAVPADSVADAANADAARAAADGEAQPVSLVEVSATAVVDADVDAATGTATAPGTDAAPADAEVDACSTASFVSAVAVVAEAVASPTVAIVDVACAPAAHPVVAEILVHDGAPSRMAHAANVVPATATPDAALFPSSPENAVLSSTDAEVLAAGTAAALSLAGVTAPRPRRADGDSRDSNGSDGRITAVQKHAMPAADVEHEHAEAVASPPCVRAATETAANVTPEASVPRDVASLQPPSDVEHPIATPETPAPSDDAVHVEAVPSKEQAHEELSDVSSAVPPLGATASLAAADAEALELLLDAFVDAAASLSAADEAVAVALGDDSATIPSSVSHDAHAAYVAAVNGIRDLLMSTTVESICESSRGPTTSQELSVAASDSDAPADVAATPLSPTTDEVPHDLALSQDAPHALSSLSVDVAAAPADSSDMNESPQQTSQFSAAPMDAHALTAAQALYTERVRRHEELRASARMADTARTIAAEDAAVVAAVAEVAFAAVAARDAAARRASAASLAAAEARFAELQQRHGEDIAAAEARINDAAAAAAAASTRADAAAAAMAALADAEARLSACCVKQQIGCHHSTSAESRRIRARAPGPDKEVRAQ